MLEEALPILRPVESDARADVSGIVRALESGRTGGLLLERLRDFSARVVCQSVISSGMPPWTMGYSLARELRKELGLDGSPLRSMREIGEALGESAEGIEDAVSRSIPGTRSLDGVVATSPDGTTGFALRDGNEAAQRFRLARGLAEFIRSPGTDAILTAASSERQQVSRAFAAEFLAPSSGLSNLVTGKSVDADDLAGLAEEFGVSSWVIEHQLRNHHIATVVAAG